MKRRIEITVETERVTLVKRRSLSAVVWCERCGRRALMVTPEEAARLDGSTAREIFRRVESGSLHFTETPEGELLVCRGSL